MYRYGINLTLAAAIASLSLAASAGIPQPNANGDFRSASAQQWRVVDTDPNGLNCRSGPGAEYPVRQKFRRNSVLFVATEHNSSGPPWIKNDSRGLPWLLVSLGDDSCFVRANARFIVPIPDRGASIIDRAIAMANTGDLQQAIAIARTVPSNSTAITDARELIQQWQPRLTRCRQLRQFVFYGDGPSVGSPAWKCYETGDCREMSSTESGHEWLDLACWRLALDNVYLGGGRVSYRR